AKGLGAFQRGCVVADGAAGDDHGLLVHRRAAPRIELERGFPLRGALRGFEAVKGPLALLLLVEEGGRDQDAVAGDVDGSVDVPDIGALLPQPPRTGAWQLILARRHREHRIDLLILLVLRHELFPALSLDVLDGFEIHLFAVERDAVEIDAEDAGSAAA